jgi:hypothetical protein
MTRGDEPMTAYNTAFRDGVLWVARQLRAAADKVEPPTRGIIERDSKTFNVIVTSGQPHFARKLREVASELESALSQ